MVDITHYEVYADRGTGWKLEERFAEEQHDQAIRYAHELEYENIAVKLIREKFNVLDNVYQETVEFVNLPNKGGQTKEKSSNFFEIPQQEQPKINTIYEAEEEISNSPKSMAIAIVKLLVIVIFSLIFANIVVMLSVPILDDFIPEESIRTLLFLFFFCLFLVVAVPLIIKKVPLQAFGVHRLKPKTKVISEKKFINKADAIFQIYNINADVDPDIAPTLPEADLHEKKYIIEFLGDIIARLDNTISITDDFNRLGLRFLIYGGCMELGRVHKLNIAEANSLLYEAFEIIDGKDADISKFYAAKNTYRDIKVAVFLTGVGAYLMSQLLHHETLDSNILRLTFNKWSNMNNIVYQTQEKEKENQKTQKKEAPQLPKKDKFFVNVLLNVFLRILYNGSKKDPKKYTEELYDSVRNIISGLAGKYNGQLINTQSNIISVQFSSINQAGRCSEEIVRDINSFVEAIADENLIIAERVNLIEGKETDLSEKETYIDDLFMQTYDGEVLFDDEIYKGIDKKAFEIEELGNKKLEKTEQSVNLYKLKFE